MKNHVPEEIEILKQQIEELKNKYLRVLADYQNLEKRAAEEKTELWKFAAEAGLVKLLPVVDTFERAQAHLQDPGLSLALKELIAVLVSLGVVKLEVGDKPFDPESMECIEVAEGPDGIVTEEVSPGYTLHGKVIRVARVKVGKKNESTNGKSANSQMNNDTH